MEVIIANNAEAAAAQVARIIAEEIAVKPRLVIGLATGRTMESVYEILVRRHREQGLDFSHCHSFNLDEYVGLAGNHPSSYRYFMNERLFNQVKINLRNTHLPDSTAADLAAECAHYEKLIVDSGGIDLQLLGIGLNGHLGFNEPLSGFRSRTRVQELSRETLAQNAPLFATPDLMPRRAITMGIGTILDARRCVLLATGKSKAEIIAQAIEGPMTALIPATALQLHGNCTIVLDENAAARLPQRDSYRRL